METIPQPPPQKLKRSYPLSPEVTAQIEVALQMDPKLLVSNAEITDFKSPYYIKDETLVYLIRVFYLEEKEFLVTDLGKVLMKRIERVLVSGFPLVHKSKIEQVYMEIVGDFFAKILDFEGESGSFYLVRFQLGVYRLAVGVFRKLEKIKGIISFSEMVREGESPDAAEDRLSYLIEGQTNTNLPTDLQVVIKIGLAQLPTKLRTVFILRHYWDWPIESLDPQIVTISKFYDKTPKTIRNWLKQADDILEKWRGAKDE